MKTTVYTQRNLTPLRNACSDPQSSFSRKSRFGLQSCFSRQSHFSPQSSFSRKSHFGLPCLLVLALLALLAACQTDDLPGNGPDGTYITLSTLQADILPMGGDAAATRNADAAPATRATADTDPDGYDLATHTVKLRFVPGDVLHLRLSVSGDGSQPFTTHLSTATLQTDGSWALSPTLVLPQHLQSWDLLDAFYDGETTPYTTDGDYLNAANTALDGELSPADGKTRFHDVLEASLIQSTITLSPSGALTLTFYHFNNLVRITDIDNRLNTPVTAIDANLVGLNNGLPSTTVPLAPAAASADVLYQAICAANCTLHSLTLTLADGSTLVLPITDAGKQNSNGQPIITSRSYTYRLLLQPGSATAIPVSGTDAPGWDDQGTTTTVPPGYTAIYDREGLEAIANNLSGKYILMTDIDLTPGRNGNPADYRWTPIGKDYLARFTGTLHGNGHTIIGMTIESDAGNVGLLGYAQGALLYNLHLREASVTGIGTNSDVGTLAGFAINCTLALCSATDCTVTGGRFTGGLVGYTDSSHLTRCHARHCTVKDAFFNAGGLAGTTNKNSRLSACYTSDCTATGNNAVRSGGIAGYYNNSHLYGCYAIRTTADNAQYKDALVGQLGADGGNSSIVSCYATNAPGSSNQLIGGKFTPYDYTAITSACVSPIKNDGREGSYTGYPDANLGVNSAYWGQGYHPLTDAGLLTAAYTAITTATKPDDGIFNSDGSLLSVRTPILAADGSLSIEERTWSAAGIWGDGTGSAGTLTQGSTHAPFIDWSYEGE